MNKLNFSKKYEKDGKTLDIIREGAFNLQVCTNFDEAEITEIVNDIYPCGTSNGWVLSKRPEVAPIKCDEKKGFTHYIFDC